MDIKICAWVGGLFSGPVARFTPVISRYHGITAPKILYLLLQELYFLLQEAQLCHRTCSCTKILVQEAQLCQNFDAATHIHSYLTNISTSCTNSLVQEPQLHQILVQETQLYQNFGAGGTTAPKFWCRRRSCAKIKAQQLIYVHI